MRSVAIQKEYARLKKLDKKLDALTSTLSRLIELMERSEDEPLEVKPAYIKKIKRVLKGIETGKVTQFKNFDDFARTVS